MLAPQHMAPWALPYAGGQMPAPSFTPAVSPSVLAALREDLIGELQAISQYEAHAAQATDPRIRDVLLHIARDEREHVVELLELIVAADPLQAREFLRARHR